MTNIIIVYYLLIEILNLKKIVNLPLPYLRILSQMTNKMIVYYLLIRLYNESNGIILPFGT